MGGNWLFPMARRQAGILEYTTRRQILMVSRSGRVQTNGSAARKCTSWIESFVDWTDNLESTELWCRWSAISTIAAVLERKVWCTTSAPLYPNLYVFLVGDA